METKKKTSKFLFLNLEDYIKTRQNWILLHKNKGYNYN